MWRRACHVRSGHGCVYAPTTAAAAATCATTLRCAQRCMSNDLFEGPLDLKAGERNARKGPPVAHSLPVYKTTHKLYHSVRWKKSNMVANPVGGKDYRLRETQGEGRLDETGMYRDWLYGDERRYVNYVGFVLGVVAIGLFFYTMRIMGAESWDIPAPVLAAQRKKLAKVDGAGSGDQTAAAAATQQQQDQLDALAMLKRPAVVTKAA